MVKYYPKAPKVSCKIKYVHKTMEEYTSPAFYMVPEIDSQDIYTRMYIMRQGTMIQCAICLIILDIQKDMQRMQKFLVTV